MAKKEVSTGTFVTELLLGVGPLDSDNCRLDLWGSKGRAYLRFFGTLILWWDPFPFKNHYVQYKPNSYNYVDWTIYSETQVLNNLAVPARLVRRLHLASFAIIGKLRG